MENCTRQDWVDAAIAAFRTGGVENVRVEAIARALEVTKGSFYWHFADRSELLDAIIEAWEEETGWLIAHASEADHPRERLIRYFSLVPKTRERYPPDVEMLAWARRDAKVNRRVKAVEDRRIAFFEQQLRHAGLRGKEASLRARMAFLASQGWIEQLSRGAHGGESFRTFATHLFDMVLKSMKTTVMVAALLACAAQLPAQQSPAVQRLREAVTVASSKDVEQMKAFAAKTYAPGFRGIAPPEVHASFLTQFAVGRIDENRIRVTGNRAVAAVDNPITEEVDSLIVVVDDSPEHLISSVGFTTGAAQGARKVYASDEARAAELKRYVKKLADADKFSGVVLLAHNGKVLVHEAYGLANRDFNVPNKPDTKFNLGSANKNFTAVVIAQLVEEGKLSWDDPLSKFLPDYPDSVSARKVLIKHLLSHSAGLGSYFNRKFMESSRTRYRTVDEMMTLARPDSLRFEPGKRFAYSNTGYLVLGKVIEVVEGRSYFDVVRDRIYKPAGMTSTDSYQLDQVNPNLAVGYTRTPGASGMELRNNIFEHVIRGGPAGGGYSNAPDMLKYDEALRAGKLIKPATLALMRSSKPELGVTPYGYGFALFDGPGIWGHGGDFPGIDFDNNQYGDSGYVLIVLANYDRVNGPILRKMKELIAM